jgi:hypothetical protein
MAPGFPLPLSKLRFATRSIASLLRGLFVLTGGCESGPEIVPPPRSGFVGPSNRDKVIIFIHGVTASNENPMTGAYWPDLYDGKGTWFDPID